MRKLAVYTAIFGGYDGLVPQPQRKHVDYICFTDQPLQSKIWKVIQIDPPVPGDAARSSRMPKIMPHLYLPDYTDSLYIDGNFLVRGDFSNFVLKLLEQKPFWAFGHGRNCIYDEHQGILELYRQTGVLKDSVEPMQHQVDRYRQEGYPEKHGLISGGVLMRRHHHPEVVRTAEIWWNEVKNGSKRDQLSFNYAAWKTGLDFGVLPGDLRRHKNFFMLGIHRKGYRAKIFRYRLKRLLGLV